MGSTLRGCLCLQDIDGLQELGSSADQQREEAKAAIDKLLSEKEELLTRVKSFDQEVCSGDGAYSLAARGSGVPA